MSLIEIKEMLNTLIDYEDSSITHTIPNLVKLWYCKASKTFQIATVPVGKVSSYHDIETACDALYIILNLQKEEGL
ncbi:hypothetical protein [Priestia endophytica]|uniref:hypothetical protein n=1 Tax=Priestia endophytica TaxID=135735 RepID=UPI000DCA535A|nr:hypothetical protein [Priestia endophytica]RAS77484.1 hypothetical protein A4U60_17885 [Priestia endophytica]